MPKSQFIDPSVMRAPGFVHFEDIPVNRYNKTIAEERPTTQPRISCVSITIWLLSASLRP